MDHPFRNAMFGGFNRQDVLTYLEQTAQEAAQRQQELEHKLDQAQETLSKQDAQLSEQEEQLGRLRQENEELRQQLGQANVELSSSRTQCSQSAGELEQVSWQLPGPLAEDEPPPEGDEDGNDPLRDLADALLSAALGGQEEERETRSAGEAEQEEP